MLERQSRPAQDFIENRAQVLRSRGSAPGGVWGSAPTLLCYVGLWFGVPDITHPAAPIPRSGFVHGPGSAGTVPAHGHLDHAMQFTEREARRHQDAPPHRRTDPDQPDFDLQDRVGVHGAIRGGGDRGRRLQPSFHPARLPPPRTPVAAYPRDPDALPLPCIFAGEAQRCSSGAR